MDEFLVHFCCRHPRGWCGLKFFSLQKSTEGSASPPARVVWIEMTNSAREKENFIVATREGGVD